MSIVIICEDFWGSCPIGGSSIGGVYPPSPPPAMPGGGPGGEADEIDPDSSNPCRRTDWHSRAEQGTIVRSFEPEGSQGALSRLMDMAKQYGNQVTLDLPGWTPVTLNQIFTNLGTVGVMFGDIDGEARGVFHYNSSDGTFEVLIDPVAVQSSASAMPGGATYTEILMATYIHEFSHMYDLINSNVSLPHDNTAVSDFPQKARELGQASKDNGESLLKIPANQNCHQYD